MTRLGRWGCCGTAAGATCAAASVTGSHLKNLTSDKEQPEELQAPVAAENLSSSQTAGTEAQSQPAETVEAVASTSVAGTDL